VRDPHNPEGFLFITNLKLIKLVEESFFQD
jgi:hypothetical protein